MTDFSLGLNELIQAAADILRARSGELRSLFILAAIAVLLGLISGISGGTSGAVSEAPLRFAGILAVAAVSIGGFRTMLNLTSEYMGQIDALSKTILPSLAAAAAASGAPASGAARQVVTALFSDMLITAVHRVLLPAVYCYLAVVTADAAAGGGKLAKFAALIHRGVSAALKAITAAFVAYLTISGAIAGHADKLAERGAKFAVSGMIPVIGGIMADAAETIVAAAGTVKAAAGVAGLLAVLGATLTPVIRLGVQYLVYKLAAAFAGAAAPPEIAAYAETLSGAFALMLGMVGAAAFMLLISIVSCLMIV